MAVKWRVVLQLQDHNRPQLSLRLRDRRAEAELDAEEVADYVNEGTGYFWVPTDDGEGHVYGGNIRGYRIERVHTDKHLSIERAAQRLLYAMTDAELDDSNMPVAVVDAMNALHRALHGDAS